MVTCRETIRAALQMTRVIAIGDEPTAAELEAGMTALQGMYERWITSGMFARLTDRYESGETEADVRDRLWVDDGTTTTLPELVDERKPRDLSIIERFDGTRMVHVWDRDAWVPMLDLTADSVAPLAGRSRTGLAACLAMEFVEMFGDDTVTVSIARMAAAFRVGLSAKVGSTQDDAEGVWF